MKSPEFWKRGRGGWKSFLLRPAAWMYRLGVRLSRVSLSVKASAPVICIGNVVAGGAGKTPVAIAVGQYLISAGLNVQYLSRGYGGIEQGPHQVDVEVDQASRVGDEPLLLSRIAPTWVAKSRVEGAQSSCDAGADVIVMDDGLQNLSLHKDISLCVIDGSFGLGNGQIMPSGPLRETLANALKKSNAVVVVGADKADVEKAVGSISPEMPILKAALMPQNTSSGLAGQRVHAFAGIGHPDKFFETLYELGCEVRKTTSFADHHAFKESDISNLVAAAQSDNALLLTTEKDYVRLDQKWSESITVLPVSLVWQNEAMLPAIFEQLLPETN